MVLAGLESRVTSHESREEKRHSNEASLGVISSLTYLCSKYADFLLYFGGNIRQFHG